jgi:hypothetical protein
MTDDRSNFLIRSVDAETKSLFTRYAHAQGLRNPDMLRGLIGLYETMSMLAIKQDNDHARNLLDHNGLKPTHLGD